MDTQIRSIAKTFSWRIAATAMTFGVSYFWLHDLSNIPRISTNVEDMAKSFGRALEFDGYCRNTFPSPDALAEAGEQALRDLGLGFRAKYVAAAAKRIAVGEIDLYSLREASYDDALELAEHMKDTRHSHGSWRRIRRPG